MEKQSQYFLVLDNIRSVHNVGSLFRIADTAGISKLYLVGTTADPIDRFGRARKDLAKVSLGAEKGVAWEHVLNLEILLKQLKKEKFHIIAIEQGDKSIDYKKIKKPAGKTAFVVGQEVSGLSPEALALTDEIAEIPMKGEKESLNVSIATAVAIFRILNI